jgi:hypothetical protein
VLLAYVNRVAIPELHKCRSADMFHVNRVGVPDLHPRNLV